MPEGLRFRLLRAHLPVCTSWPEPLVIKLAETEEELASAYRLLHDSYVKAGFMIPHPSGMRILPQHLLPQASTIVAKWDGVVIGTISLIRDNALGLPMEKLFDLTPLRRRVGRLAEVSSLAVDPSFRGKVDQALFPLFRYVYQYGLQCFGIHGFAIAVNPSMADLYRAFLLFDKIEDEVKSYEFVNGAPAAGLFLDFSNLTERWSVAFRKRPDHVHWYNQDIRNCPGNVLPSREYHVSSDPVITPELLEKFFLGRAQIVQSFSVSEFQAVRSAYPHPAFQKIFDRALSGALPERKEIRVDTKMRVRAELKGFEGEAWNVSSNGLQLRCERPLEQDEVLQLAVKIDTSTEVRITARVRWESPGLYGLEIAEAPIEWTRMNEILSRKIDELVRIAV